MRRPRRPKDIEHASDHEGSWAISYGDMITLLLAFFIIFFSIQTPEKVRKALNNSMIASLALLDPKLEEKNHQDNAKKPHDQLERSGPEQNKSAHQGEEQVQRAVNLKTEKAGIQIEKSGEKVVISFPDTSFFSSGNTDLTPDGQKDLDKFVARYLPFAGQNTLHIVGYSDKRPVSRGRRYRDNLELSVLRAVAAQRYLQNAGIPLDRTRLAGFGVSQIVGTPSQTISDDQQLALSRKIVLIIEPEGDRK